MKQALAMPQIDIVHVVRPDELADQLIHLPASCSSP